MLTKKEETPQNVETPSHVLGPRLNKRGGGRKPAEHQDTTLFLIQMQCDQLCDQNVLLKQPHYGR